MRDNFRGKPRRLKLEQMHMNVQIFKQVSDSLKRAVATLRVTWANVPFLLTVLAFRCPLSLFPNLTAGAG